MINMGRKGKGDMRVLFVAVLYLFIVFALCPSKCIGGEVKIPSTTKVLDDEILRHISISEDGSVLELDITNPMLLSLSCGDVIVGGVSNATPYGLAPRRVVSIEKKVGKIIFKTSPATLGEAIEKGKIEKRTSLKPDDLINKERLE